MKMKELATVNESLPTPSTGNPFLDVAAEGGSAFGKIIKFNKGRWLCGDDEIPAASEYICHIGSAMRGWVKFIDVRSSSDALARLPTGLSLRRANSLATTSPPRGPKRTSGAARAILGQSNILCRWFRSMVAKCSRLSLVRRAARLLFATCALCTDIGLTATCRSAP